nr:hypothetical protein [uncultured Prevotella sp.]
MVKMKRLYRNTAEAATYILTSFPLEITAVEETGLQPCFHTASSVVY